MDRANALLAGLITVALAHVGSACSSDVSERGNRPLGPTPSTAQAAAEGPKATSATSVTSTTSDPPTSTSSSAGAPMPSVRYLALGDSFTIGTGSSPSEAFPARLAEAWSQCKVDLTNLAKNGFTSGDVLRVEVPRAGDIAPTFVTVAAGANDIVQRVPEGRYRDHLKSIFRALRDANVAPDHTVALPQPDWSLSPAAKDFGEPATIAARIERYNAILAEEATSAGARYVDIFPLMRELAQRGMIAGDGLHPSAKAHAAWAQALAAQLGSCGAFR